MFDAIVTFSAEENMTPDCQYHVLEKIIKEYMSELVSLDSRCHNRKEVFWSILLAGRCDHQDLTPLFSMLRNGEVLDSLKYPFRVFFIFDGCCVNPCTCTDSELTKLIEIAKGDV